MLAHQRMDAAHRAAGWLAEQQARNGTIGVTASRSSPHWPTALAMLVWHSIDQATGGQEFKDHLSRAIDWSLAEHGKPAPRSAQFGHDSTIAGWSWAANTHSWLEPTAMFVLALKSVGHSQHARTRDGVRLLIDRQLPNGGCNYGNTIVLGQPLLAHAQPTGLAMLALAGEGYDDPRTERSLRFLERELSQQTATASLCYGVLGLAAHGRAPATRDTWLRQTYSRVVTHNSSPHKLALIALAAADHNVMISKTVLK